MAAAFIEASHSVHDRDFPLGARWGGWCKSERAGLGQGHHSSFHLSPPGGRTVVTCSMWIGRTAGGKHTTGVKHRTNKALEVQLGLVFSKHAFLLSITRILMTCTCKMMPTSV